jgi:hypothetical protein
MKRGVVGILGLFLLAALSASAQEAPLAPGGIRVNGFVNEFEQFYLDVTALQAGEDLPQILAVKIYSEPSHTLLFAQVDEAAPVSLLTAIQAERPAAMTTNPIGGGLVRVHLPVPPTGDTRVRVDFVRLNNGVARATTVGEYETSSLLNFDFSAEPLAGKFKLCGYCSGFFCKCVYCATPLFTTCCPACEVFCGIVTCP